MIAAAERLALPALTHNENCRDECTRSTGSAPRFRDSCVSTRGSSRHPARSCERLHVSLTAMSGDRSGSSCHERAKRRSRWSGKKLGSRYTLAGSVAACAMSLLDHKTVRHRGPAPQRAPRVQTLRRSRRPAPTSCVAFATRAQATRGSLPRASCRISGSAQFH